VSRLNDLLRQLRMDNPGLADDLQSEFDALADLRSFGLNFERHVPEAVELPGRKVRKGDKVRALPPRGKNRTAGDDRLWRVVGITNEDGARTASLLSLDDAEDETSVTVDDLVVVAEFRDPIYPGLVSTGKVERGGDKPFHTVINAENFHALQTLLFTHRGKVDCIYIDPPYNTGAKDWKYNNDYVEGDDHYRHSKWLAMMERRLLLAKDLLNPNDAVLMVTIDEREYLRLGMLLEQTFPSARIQMVSTVIKPSGQSRAAAFARTDEYVFFVMFGEAAPRALPLGTEWKIVRDRRAEGLRWTELLRSGSATKRSDRPNQFFPVFIRDTPEGPVFEGVGEPYFGSDTAEIEVPPGSVAVWPIRSDGSEGRWQVSDNALAELISKGYAKLGRWREGRTSITYLKRGEQSKVEAGTFPITDHDTDGSIIVDASDYSPTFVPGTQWRIESHNPEQGGTNLQKALIPNRKFPYPKSLYAVEDALRFFVSDKLDAVVLDFFAGSGTTGHAVMRLNHQDDGHRQSVLITNNEVEADERKKLSDSGLRPGDPEWEQSGICEFFTKPRIKAALEGQTPEGQPVKGNYKFTDEFPLSDGFDENVEFFTLTYEAPLRLASHRDFERIGPLLWLRAGSKGRRIQDVTDGWDVADVYGVIADLDQTEDFLKAVAANDRVEMAFIVTDEDRLFESMVAELPDDVEPVRLYEAYLRNFEIEAGRSAR